MLKSIEVNGIHFNARTAKEGDKFLAIVTRHVPGVSERLIFRVAYGSRYMAAKCANLACESAASNHAYVN